MFERITTYFKSVRAEIARVTWPTRNEVISLTALIVLLVTIITLYIWGIDGILGTLLKILVRSS